MYAESTRPSVKREVQQKRSAERDDQIARPRRAQTCERSARWECACEAGRFFVIESPLPIASYLLYFSTIKLKLLLKISTVAHFSLNFWNVIPAQSKASFFHRKVFKFFKYLLFFIYMFLFKKLLQRFQSLKTLYLKLETVEFWRIFSPKKYAMIYENPIICKQLVKSNSKEKFLHEKTILKLLFFVN